MARKTLTDKGVGALKSRTKLYAHPDPQLPGHYIRVSPTGSKSFVAVARDPRGKQIWTTIGSASLISVEDSREKAREVIKRIKAGEDRVGPQSFQTVAAEWLRRHVEAKGLRSDYEIRRLLNRDILPVLGGRDFISIRRGDITKLLDAVTDNSGPRSADYVLSIISNICGWYARRHDDYASPIIRGMSRHPTRDNARNRILNDDEIRAVWNAADGLYGDLLKLALLTGQRQDKVASMRWNDISIDGAWHVPNGIREKGAGGTLVLPAMALDIIRTRPRLGDNPYVFAGRSDSHFNGYAKAKAALDAKVPIPHWQFHDLRRTARSLMSRANVRPDVAERVLGHAIKGVEGVYDRHSYREEKAHALRALAGLIEKIVNPPLTNVTPIRGVM
jgi:integrase